MLLQTEGFKNVLRFQRKGKLLFYLKGQEGIHEEVKLEQNPEEWLGFEHMELGWSNFRGKKKTLHKPSTRERKSEIYFTQRSLARVAGSMNESSG